MDVEAEKGACLQAALVAALDRGDAAELLVAQLQGKVCRFTDALAARDARSAEATAQAKSELTEAESRATAAEVICPPYFTPLLMCVRGKHSINDPDI